MISAVSRTLAILECLSEDPHGATVSALASRLGIEKSIVSRILATLEADKYVVRSAKAERFELGLKFGAITLRHIDNLGFSNLCLPLLRELADSTGELIQLAIVQQDQMIYVAQVEGQQRIRILSLIGHTAVLHASSAGKVWLASLPEKEAVRIVLAQGLKPNTDKTITTIDQFRSELLRVRKRGYATVDQELIEGAAAISVPIWNKRGDRVLGAVVLSSPAYRLSKKRIVSLVPIIKKTAMKLEQLGNIDAYFDGAFGNSADLPSETDRQRA